MAQRKITTGGIANDAITTDLLGDNLELQGNYVKVPVGDTASRPSGEAGVMRFNTDTNSMEQYDGTSWVSIAKPPIISSLSYPGSQTAVSPDGGETITISGTNFTTGVNVKFGTTYATSVTRTNSTSLSVVVPALTAATYDVIVENGDGMQATLSSGLESNAAPVFTTAAGSLGSIQNDQTISTITIVATEDDSGAITYGVTTGALPTGLTLSGADIGGAPTGYTAETTVNFTITATDDEGQTTSRAFSLTVLVGFYSYEIEQSLRFNDDDSAYLSRSFGSGGNQKTWTWSGWFKRGASKIPGSTYNHFLFGGINNGYGVFYRENPNNPSIEINVGNSGNIDTNTTIFLRDHSSWYHIVAVMDCTNSTESERLRCYLNGVRLTPSDVDLMNMPTYDTDAPINAATTHWMGKQGTLSRYGDFYQAECHFIDGQALTASSFGEFKQDVWVPKEYTGTYGTTGFYLPFEEGANGLYEQDRSGNGNHWTAVNMTQAADVMLDSPTNNFATLNPIQKTDGNTAIEFSEGNLKANNTNSSLWAGAYSTFAVSSGKWYWEWKMVEGDSTGDFQSGIQIFDGTTTLDWDAVSPQSFHGTILYYGDNGQKRINNSLTNYGTSYGNGDIIGVALDLDSATQTVTFYKNGTSQGAINLSLSTSEVVTVTPAFAFYIDAFVVNFGQDSSFAGTETRQNNTDSEGIGDFYYAPPSGYLALCNNNLPENTFDLLSGEKPSEHFNVVTYSGQSGDQSITGVGFQPDLVWIKERISGGDHVVTDVVRGVTKDLHTNTTDAESTEAEGLQSFDTDGFTVGDDNGNYNRTGRTYVAWCWKANGTPVSNTDGSVTSQVSANTTAGFSIVSYTGGDSDETIGHGLSQAPEVVIVKRRDSTGNWASLWNKLSSTNKQLYWNLTGGLDTNNISDINSSTFRVSGWSDVVVSGGTYVAYCWYSVPGFSKIGQYIGTGSVDGTFVYTGFKPAFIITKKTSGDRWIISDTKRSPYNPSDEWHDVANATIEGNFGAGNALDILSNGFKLKTTDSLLNGDGSTYIFMAFAEDPFKYGNAR